MTKWKNINDGRIEPPEYNLPLICIMKYNSHSLNNRFAYRLLYKSLIENEYKNPYYSVSNCMPLDDTMTVAYWMYAEEFVPEDMDDIETFYTVKIKE